MTDIMTKFVCAVKPYVDFISPDHWIGKTAHSHLHPDISGSYGNHFAAGQEHIEFVESTSDPQNPFKDASNYPVDENELADILGCPPRVDHVTIGMYKGKVRVEFHGSEGTMTDWDESESSQRKTNWPQTLPLKTSMSNSSGTTTWGVNGIYATINEAYIETIGIKPLHSEPAGPNCEKNTYTGANGKDFISTICTQSPMR